MRRIKLTQGQFAIVDAKNYKWLSQYKWFVIWNKDTKSFYAARKSGNYTISMAREILGLKKGDKHQADHINHSTLDNQISNLRIVTCQQNDLNRKNTKGYYWNKRGKKYYARINVNGKVIHLGCFNTPEEAHSAYLKVKEKYHKI